MNGYTLPSFRVTMIWLFGIMITCFSIGGILLFLESGEHEIPTGKSDEFKIPSEGIDKARINLEIDSGSVNLTSGSGEDILSGTVHYEGMITGPRLSHIITNRTGNIVIERKKNIVHDLIGGEENWDIILQNNTPISLLLTLGTGDIRVDAGSAALSELGIENGAGSAYVDLHEWNDTRLDVHIDNGVGELTLLLPESSDIFVSMDRAVGNSVISGFTENEQGYYHTSTYPVTSEIYIHISQGLGDLTLKTISP